MYILRTIGILSIPLTFLCAGIGMLLQLQVEQASGSFIQQIRAEESAWILSHLILLGSTFFLLPAAITLRSCMHKYWTGLTGTVMVVIVAITSILLAGQYAIDFTMPLIAAVDGAALMVHQLLFETPLINTLFYNLPNLVFLALFVLSILLIPIGVLSRKNAIFLVLNWLAVILGNLVDPAFQRICILLLAVSFMPLVVRMLKHSENS